MAKKKSRVKSVARSERMKKLWADPAYKARMSEKAKAQRKRDLEKKGGVNTQATPAPGAADPAPAPLADDPPRPTPATKSERRGYGSPGRAWR